MTSLQRRTIALALFLVLICTANCANKKVATNVPASPAAEQQISRGDKFIQDVKKYGPTLVIAIEEGIKQENLFAQGTVDDQGNRLPPIIDATLHQKLTPWLQAGLGRTRHFVEVASHWEHFDLSNKAYIGKFLDDAFAFVEQSYDEGVLRIKNPRSQQIASGILSGAKITLSLLRQQFLEVAQ